MGGECTSDPRAVAWGESVPVTQGVSCVSAPIVECYFKKISVCIRVVWASSYMGYG